MMTHGSFTVLGFPGVRQFIDLVLGVVQVQGQLLGERERKHASAHGKTSLSPSQPFLLQAHADIS